MQTVVLILNLSIKLQALSWINNLVKNLSICEKAFEAQCVILSGCVKSHCPCAVLQRSGAHTHGYAEGTTGGSGLGHPGGQSGERCSQIGDPDQRQAGHRQENRCSTGECSCFYQQCRMNMFLECVFLSVVMPLLPQDSKRCKSNPRGCRVAHDCRLIILQMVIRADRPLWNVI